MFSCLTSPFILMLGIFEENLKKKKRFLTGEYFMIEQAFLVTVRNKKRVGYTYELTLKIEGNLGLNVISSFTL